MEKKTTTMIMDDKANLVESLKTTLENENYIVIIASEQEQAKRVLRHDEHDPFCDYYYALSLYKLGRPKEAEGVLSRLTKEFPRVSRYYHALGIVQRVLDDNEAALESFRKAISLAPEAGRVAALCSLADILTEIGRAKEAIPVIEQALELEPAKSFVVAIASMVYDAVGQTNAALEIAREGLRIFPNDTHLHHMAGMLLKKMKLYSDAKGHVEQAELAPRIRHLLEKAIGKIKVLIVDDHTIVRNGISAVLALEKDVELVGEAGDGKDALEKVLRFMPNVVLMDIAMPVMNGLEATKQISKECPQSKVLILTQYDEEENMRVARKAGAYGFIPKIVASSDLVTGIRTVNAGKYFPSSFAEVSKN